MIRLLLFKQSLHFSRWSYHSPQVWREISWLCPTTCSSTTIRNTVEEQRDWTPQKVNIWTNNLPSIYIWTAHLHSDLKMGKNRAWMFWKNKNIEKIFLAGTATITARVKTKPQCQLLFLSDALLQGVKISYDPISEECYTIVF